MKKYTIDDLMVLDSKLCDCLYSWNRMKVFANEGAVMLQAGGEFTEANEFQMNYYTFKYLHEMSELYTFFHKQGDTTISSRFKASEDERLKLKAVRHPLAHVDSDLNKTRKSLTDYRASTTPTTQATDLIYMIKYVRQIANAFNAETTFLSHLNMVQNIFPLEIIEEDLRKYIFE